MRFEMNVASVIFHHKRAVCRTIEFSHLLVDKQASQPLATHVYLLYHAGT